VRLPAIGIVFFFQLAWGQILNGTQALMLQRIYHHSSSTNFKSEFEDPDFFISPKGSTDFDLEVTSLIEAFQDPTKKFTKDQLPAACLFPARKMILEQILNLKFPTPACKDYEVWRSRLKTTHLSLLFAGAYSQNPASLFGHTMIRLSDRGDQVRTSPLLSYVVGFLAQTGDDGTLTRFQKGLTGKYPGYFQLEPFYLKLGLYNNSESRDIWEVDLKLSAQEIDLFLAHLWEVSRFAKPYFFVKKNCSYQLLKLLEAIKPNLNLTRGIYLETLPHETVRMMTDQGLTTESYLFYPSLQRKLTAKIETLSSEQRDLFNRALINEEAMLMTQDVLVLDTLIMHWQLKNYQSHLKLAPSDSILMEKTYLKRSQISAESNSSEQVYQTHGPRPPFHGHRSRQLKWGSSQKAATISYRSGVHGFDQSALGFDDFSAIQYLGMDAYFNYDTPQNSEFDFLVADIRSFEDLFSQQLKKSWMLKMNFQSKSEFQESKSSTFNAKAGIGISQAWGSVRAYSLVVLKSESLLSHQTQTLFRMGVLSGFKIEFKKHRILAELDTEFLKDRTRQQPLFQWAYSLNLNNSILARYEPLFVNDQMSTSLNFEHNF
jgi:hypothetical protein